MKRRCFLILAVFSIGFFSLVAFAWEIQPSKEIQNSGQIHGVVDYCAHSGPAGLEVYIPGRSFFAKLGATGDFTLSYVPEGTYNLVIMKSGDVLHTLTDVRVVPKSITELGAINICSDNDNDGYDASSDCDDSNPTVYPGATELCNDIDDDCDDSVDEECPACEPGASCDPGVSEIGVCVAIDPVYDENCSCVYDLPSSYSTTEICDGLDNDCDGITDEQAVCPENYQCAKGDCVPL